MKYLIAIILLSLSSFSFAANTWHDSRSVFDSNNKVSAHLYNETIMVFTIPFNGCKQKSPDDELFSSKVMINEDEVEFLVSCLQKGLLVGHPRNTSDMIRTMSNFIVDSSVSFRFGEYESVFTTDGFAERLEIIRGE